MGLHNMAVTPDTVHSTLGKYMLVDGFDLVFDMQKSSGCRIYNARTNQFMLDGFSYFASAPLGTNHPKLTTPEFIQKIGWAAVNKPTNSDLYTIEMAEFVDTFGAVAMPDYFAHLFFVSGGTLAVENALKTAFDWKVQKNFEKGYKEEVGSKVIHFKEAFHGRSGYTLSCTNTFNLDKTNYFPKFDWPRIVNPKITFPLNETHQKEVEDLERQALSEISKSIEQNKDDIAALIIEPIQGEGGDNHFRGEFLRKLRTICDEHEIIYILDEIQSGVGLTGKMWAYEHFDFEPDIVAFGKKTQVCGIMVSDCIDDIKDNVFAVSSRINSTWGGNLVDMIRCQKYLEVIRDEKLLDNAQHQGELLRNGLEELALQYPEKILNARGRGLMCAFDLPTPEKRDQLRQQLYNNNLIVLGCGVSTIRFRPPLIITEEEIDELLQIVESTVRAF